MDGVETRESPRIGPSGLAALRATRPWALFVGIVTCVLALFCIVEVAVYWLLGTVGLDAGISPRIAALSAGFAIASAVIGVVFNGLGGWFALQLGRAIKSSLDEASPQRLEAALWWQRRYWTLQGVLIIVLIVMAVLFPVLVGIAGMAHHGGYGA